MIRYVDLDRSSAERPNENFARELFELFMPGEGAYTEEDVREAARAFTGYRQISREFRLRANLPGVLSRSLAAFQQDLKSHGLDDQVLTMTFSEFGRRPDENGSRGTDHGTAAPLFVLGKHRRPGIFGQPPDLFLDPREPIPFSYDFRQVYATVLDKWFGCPADEVLDGAFERLEFL